MKKILSFLLVLILIFSLSLSAFAVEFVQSIYRKDAITVVPQEDEDGDPYTAVIEDEDGNKTYIKPEGEEELELVVTPIASKGHGVIVEIDNYLEKAEREIEAAADVGKLTPEMETALQAMKDASSDPLIQELSIADLVVSDLFDVCLVRNRETEEVVERGNYITFSVKTTLRPGDVFFVLHSPHGVGWEVVDLYELDETGLLTICLNGLCPVAIVVDTAHNNGGEVPEKSDTDTQTGTDTNTKAPTSPQTSDEHDTPFLYGTILFGGAAAAFGGAALLSRKKKSEK